MASKKSYSRYFIILQEDEKGYVLEREKSSSGYVKLEKKNNKCKVSFYAQNINPKMEPYYMVLVCSEKDKNKLVVIGKLPTDEQGKIDVNNEYDLENIGNAKISMAHIKGACIAKVIDNNIISLMSGFTNNSVPKDWKGYEVIKVYEEKAKRKEELEENTSKKEDKKAKDSSKKEERKEQEVKEEIEEKVFVEYEEKIKSKIEEKNDSPVEDNPRKEEPHKDSNVEETSKEKQTKTEVENSRVEVEDKKTEAEKSRDEIEDKKTEAEKSRDEIEDKKTEIEKSRDEIEDKKTETDKNRVELENKEIQTNKNTVETECRETVSEKNRDQIEYDSYKNEEKLEHIIGNEIETENYLREFMDSDIPCNSEEDLEFCTLQENMRKKKKCKKEEECSCYLKDYPKGRLGSYFKSLACGFEEVKDMCHEIPHCRWYKIPVTSLEDMYDNSDYHRYTVIYYPMICYYSYISRHEHFCLGYKCNKDGKLMYILYAIPGKKDMECQPYRGRTGFVTWVPSKDKKDHGYWIMFYDFRKSTVVIPIKK